MTRPFALFLLGALAAFPSGAFAQDRSGINVDPVGTGKRGGPAQVALAQDLYAHGMETQDALLVLAATKLAFGVTFTDVARERETAGAVPEEGGAAEGPIGAAAMLASARALAGEDEVILGLIEEVEAEGSRGRTNGAARSLSHLPVGGSDRWKVPFYGSAYAEVAVVGDGASNLDVRISDENGNTICDNVSWSDRLHCDFVPAWNGYFFIDVRNVGRHSNSYVLLTN